MIAYDGRSEADEKDLRTEKTFGDFSVIADWRWTDDRDARTLPIRLDGVVLPAEALPQSLARFATEPSSDGWRRAILTKRGGRLSLVIDRQTVFETWPLAGAAARAGSCSGTRDARSSSPSIFVRELSAARPPQP